MTTGQDCLVFGEAASKDHHHGGPSGEVDLSFSCCLCSKPNGLVCCDECSRIFHENCGGFIRTNSGGLYCAACTCLGCGTPCLGKETSVKEDMPSADRKEVPSTWGMLGVVALNQSLSQLLSARQAQVNTSSSIVQPCTEEHLDLVNGCTCSADVERRIADRFPNLQHQPAADVPLQEFLQSLLPAEEWKGRGPAISVVAQHLFSSLKPTAPPPPPPPPAPKPVLEQRQQPATTCIDVEVNPTGGAAGEGAVGSAGRRSSTSRRSSRGLRSRRRTRDLYPDATLMLNTLVIPFDDEESKAAEAGSTPEATATVEAKSTQLTMHSRDGATVAVGMQPSSAEDARQPYCCCVGCGRRCHIQCLRDLDGGDTGACCAGCWGVGRWISSKCGHNIMPVGSLPDGTQLSLQLVTGEHLATCKAHKLDASALKDTTKVLNDCLIMSHDAAHANLVSNAAKSLLQRPPPRSSAADDGNTMEPAVPGPIPVAALLWAGANIAGLALLDVHGVGMAQVLHLSCAVPWQSQSLHQELLSCVELQLAAVGVHCMVAQVREAVLAGSMPDSAGEGRLVIRLKLPVKKAMVKEARCAQPHDGSFTPSRAVPAAWPMDAGYVEVPHEHLQQLACYRLAHVPATRIMLKALQAQPCHDRDEYEHHQQLPHQQQQHDDKQQQEAMAMADAGAPSDLLAAMADGGDLWDPAAPAAAAAAAGGDSKWPGAAATERRRKAPAGGGTGSKLSLPVDVYDDGCLMQQLKTEMKQRGDPTSPPEMASKPGLVAKEASTAAARSADPAANQTADDVAQLLEDADEADQELLEQICEVDESAEARSGTAPARAGRTAPATGTPAKAAVASGQTTQAPAAEQGQGQASTAPNKPASPHCSGRAASRSRTRSPSQARSGTHSRSLSRSRSPTPLSQSRSRSRSRSLPRSQSRSRSRSASYSRSRSRSRSHSRLPVPTRPVSQKGRPSARQPTTGIGANGHHAVLRGHQHPAAAAAPAPAKQASQPNQGSARPEHAGKAQGGHNSRPTQRHSGRRSSRHTRSPSTSRSYSRGSSTSRTTSTSSGSYTSSGSDDTASSSGTSGIPPSRVRSSGRDHRSGQHGTLKRSSHPSRDGPYHHSQHPPSGGLRPSMRRQEEEEEEVEGIGNFVVRRAPPNFRNQQQAEGDWDDEYEQGEYPRERYRRRNGEGQQLTRSVQRRPDGQSHRQGAYPQRDGVYGEPGEVGYVQQQRGTVGHTGSGAGPMMGRSSGMGMNSRMGPMGSGMQPRMNSMAGAGRGLSMAGGRGMGRGDGYVQGNPSTQQAHGRGYGGMQLRASGSYQRQHDDRWQGERDNENQQGKLGAGISMMQGRNQGPNSNVDRGNWAQRGDRSQQGMGQPGGQGDAARPHEAQQFGRPLRQSGQGGMGGPGPLGRMRRRDELCEDDDRGVTFKRPRRLEGAPACSPGALPGQSLLGVGGNTAMDALLAGTAGIMPALPLVPDMSAMMLPPMGMAMDFLDMSAQLESINQFLLVQQKGANKKQLTLQQFQNILMQQMPVPGQTTLLPPDKWLEKLHREIARELGLPMPPESSGIGAAERPPGKTGRMGNGPPSGYAKPFGTQLPYASGPNGPMRRSSMPPNNKMMGRVQRYGSKSGSPGQVHDNAGPSYDGGKGGYRSSSHGGSPPSGRPSGSGSGVRGGPLGRYMPVVKPLSGHGSGQHRSSSKQSDSGGGRPSGSAVAAGSGKK